MNKSKDYYNSQPVEVCKNCNSLAIKEYMSVPLCADCGAVNYTYLETIENWLNANSRTRKNTNK